MSARNNVHLQTAPFIANDNISFVNNTFEPKRHSLVLNSGSDPLTLQHIIPSTPDVHSQKRIFSNASNQSYKRDSSRGSEQSSNLEGVSSKQFYANEPRSQRSSVIIPDTFQADHSGSQNRRSSSYVSTEELVNQQTAHYKPFYAQKQGASAQSASNRYYSQQQFDNYQASRFSVHSDNTFSQPKQTISGKNSIGTHLPTKSSMKQQPMFGPYILGKTIGEGEFGKVKLAWSTSKKTKDSLTYHLTSSLGSMKTDLLDRDKVNGKIDPEDMPKQVAVKLIKNSSIPEGSETETKLFREINSLRVLTHPNIVRLEEVIRNDTHIGIVLEYASGGEFYKYIQEKKRLKESEGCRLFAQLISGVQYMHSKGMAHRDLKLENLLLDRFENLIITDFGFVNEFQPGKNELMKTSCGSPCYAAPELVVSSRPYSARKADLWSCGIILFAILAGYLPWDDDSNNPDGDDIAKLYMYITQTSLKFPEYITPVPRDLLRRILVPNPKHRLNMDQVYQHQWLKSHRPFLSIAPEEWDRFLSSDNNKVYRSKQIQNTRQVRPKSCYSANGEKRNSLVLENSYSFKALPPKESYTVATIKTDQLPAAIAVQNMNYSNRTNRHESIDFSQLNGNYQYRTDGKHSPQFTFEKPVSIVDSSNNVLPSSRNNSEISFSQSPTGSSIIQKNNNSTTSFHRRNNSAASLVLQQVIDESDLHLQQQQNKFQPTKPRRARPMSYQPGGINYFGSNYSEEKEPIDVRSLEQGYNRFTNTSSNVRNKKHSSTIHEEEGPEMVEYKLNKFNQMSLEDEGFDRNNLSNGRIRNVSEASSSTIGTPTKLSSTNSKHYYSEKGLDTSQNTKVTSQGTSLSRNGSTSKKSKRFSLLSFYSLYDSNNSKTSIPAANYSSNNLANSNINDSGEITESGNDSYDSPIKNSLQERIFNAETPTKNRKSDKGIDSDSQSRSSFSTQSASPRKSQKPGSNTLTNSAGNTSTTRRVIDFFKRRSIRL